MHRRPSINIVPLVDVLIILLFFFLMTMQMPSQKFLNITLPEVTTAGKNKVSDHLVLTVDASGSYWLNQQSVTEAEILASIEAAAQMYTERNVLIVADEDTPLQRVTSLMDACRQNQLENIRLQTR